MILQTLLLDGKLQSAEADERVYHESLVLPAMLHHPKPKRVFICGGGEGATAREVLRHSDVEEVVMADIDRVVCDFCREYLPANTPAFNDPRLKVHIGDAKSLLEQEEGTFDVIIGDLADPIEGGPSYWLYTQNFYEHVIKCKLNIGGLFVTQSGPGGYLTYHQVFAPINRTLREVFPYVVPYNAHVPSFADMWSWNLAFSATSEQRLMSAAELERVAQQKLKGESEFLDGQTFHALTAMNKKVRDGVSQEDTILTEENPRFIPGSGLKKA